MEKAVQGVGVSPIRRRMVAHRRKIPVVFLIFILITLFGLNVYRNLYDSSFSLTVDGDYPLRQGSLGFGQPAQLIHPAQQTDGQETYPHLHTYGWANHSTYVLGSPRSGLWFGVKRTLGGRFALVPGDVGTPAVIIGIEIRDPSGRIVSDLLPGRWYVVQQYGHPLRIELSG